MSSYDNTCINKHLKHWFANYHSDSWNWLTAASMFQISAIWYEIYFSILITSVFKNSFNVLDAQTSHFSLEFDWLFLTWTAIFISFRITSPSVYTKSTHTSKKGVSYSSFALFYFTLKIFLIDNFNDYLSFKSYWNYRPFKSYIIPVHQTAFQFPQKHRTCDDAGVINTETAKVSADQGLIYIVFIYNLNSWQCSQTNTKIKTKYDIITTVINIYIWSQSVELVLFINKSAPFMTNVNCYFLLFDFILYISRRFDTSTDLYRCVTVRYIIMH